MKLHERLRLADIAAPEAPQSGDRQAGGASRIV